MQRPETDGTAKSLQVTLQYDHAIDLTLQNRGAITARAIDSRMT